MFSLSTARTAVNFDLQLRSMLRRPPDKRAAAARRTAAPWNIASPLPMKNAPVAVPKGKGQCPSTMRQSGNYCIDTEPQRR